MGNEIMPGRLSSAAAEKIEYDNWEDYEAASELWRRQHTARVVGYFACSPEQQAFDQCCTLPIPPIDTAPVLVLPLRFHLSRGPELGCALSERDCQEEILSTVNGLWEQAGVQWFLEGVVKEDWSAVRSAGVDLCAVRDQIWSLQRDPATGQMAGKEFRRKIFLEQLLLNHAQDMHTFDVYFFDLVGQQSQGKCI